jgi:tetratricopeptide (TPR) repeat protein
MEWVTTLSTQDLDVCADALRRAVTIQEEAVRQQPSAATKNDLLDALAALGEILTMKGDRQEAARALQRAEELLRATPEAGPGQVCNVLGAGAMLAGQRGNAKGAIQRLHKAIEAAEKWAEQEPSWLEPRKRLLDQRGSLVQQLAAQGDVRAVTEASKAAIASAEVMAARFTEDPLARGQLAAHLGALATALLPLGRRDVLAEAETCARRAFEVSELVPDSVDLRLRMRARWLFLCHLGIVLDARGSSDAPATWEQASQAIDAWRERFGVGADDAVAFAEAALRVARYRLGAGSDDRAGEVLDRVQAVVEAQPKIEGMPEQAVTMHRLRARLLARRGDDAGAAAESERLRSVAGGRGVLAAAEAMHAAWRAARSGSDPARATRHRDRAIELHRAAIDALREAARLSPADPWIVVPLGQSSLRLAEMLGDRGEEDAAQDLLAEALPSLAALRDQVHADMWDEALYVAGQAMAKR